MINFRLSLRNILRSKTYLILNLIGLSIAFSVSFFIMSYIIREAVYNRNFDNYDRIVRPLTVKNQFGWTEPSVSYPLHLKLKNDIPGIEAAAIFRSIGSVRLQTGESSIRMRNGYSASSEILKILSPDFIFRTKDRFGEDPYSILISEGLAYKLFGNIPEPGSSLKASVNGKELIFTVDGVYKDFPATSSYKPELLASFDLMGYVFPEGSHFANFRDKWHMDVFRELVLLEESADFISVNERVAGLAEDVPYEIGYEFALQPMSKIHLHSSGLVNDGKKGDIKMVLLFAAVGLLILIIAISNYVILSIGSSSRRIPEISTRKIFGAKSFSVRAFILLESVLICMVSLPIAYLIYRIAFTGVEQLFNINMELTQINKLLVMLFVFFLALTTGLVSGSYLAGSLGRTSPIAFIKRFSSKTGGKLLYKSLVTVQIVIFVSLLSSSFIVLNQINYSKNHDPGFKSENLVKASFPSGLIKDFNSFRHELKKNPNIEELTFGGLLPPTVNAMVTIVKPMEGGEGIRVEGISADYNFIEVTRAEIIAGRDFNPELASDSSATIINETLAHRLGVNGYNINELTSPRNVIGIMKDIQIHSVREDIRPMTLRISKGRYISSMLARVIPGAEQSVKKTITSAFSKFDPAFLEVSAYDQIVKNMYGEEARLGTIVIVFGIIALIVAMLGVFGLSLFLSGEFVFDIAIMRVMGASGRSIIIMNTLKYLLFVIVGNVISIPLVIIIMNGWLQQFAFRVTITPWIFIAAFLLSSAIFILTTLSNTIRLANINPVDNLRQ